MFTYQTLIRDKLVDNATFKGLFNATATGSCRVNFEFLSISAAYPQVIMSYGGGETVSNMDGDDATMFLTVQCRGSGSTHAHKELGNFRSAILNVVDDTALQSDTGVCYLFKKFSEVVGYNEDDKYWFLRMGFQGDFKQKFNLP